MTELLDQYPAALEIIHSYFETKAEANPPPPAQPASTAAKAQVKPGSDGNQAPLARAELRELLSKIFQSPQLTKNLVEKNPGMIAELFR